MKKLFTLTFMMVMGCMMSFAQSVEFVDKDGKTIANGSTILASETVDQGWCVEVGPGIYVNNKNEKAPANVDVRLIVKQMSEGSMASFCAGGDCSPLKEGSDITKSISVKANDKSGVETHWSYYPDDPIGLTAEMEFILMEGGKEVSKVTVMFSNDPNAAGIDSIIASDAKCNVYDITGKLVKANVSKNAVYGMSKGIYIVRELSGAKNVNKVIVK